MTRWRVVVADDEPLARLGVRQLLARHPGFVVVGECRDGIEAGQALTRGGVDLLFLDIAMPGLDGVDVVRQHAADTGTLVVFLTAHSTRAVEAFETGAMDYLVKPVAEERFALTMTRATQWLEARSTATRSPTLRAQTRSGTMILPAREVEWIEGDNHYARVWHQGRDYLVREPLDALETRLAGAGFVRVHRGALVRCTAIVRLTRNAAGRPVVVLRSHVTVSVARRRVAEVMRALAVDS